MRVMIAVFCLCLLAGCGLCGERDREQLDLAIDSCWPRLVWNDIAPEGREILSRNNYAALDQSPQVEEAKRDAFIDKHLTPTKQKQYKQERETYFEWRAPLIYGGSMFAVTVKTPSFTDLTPQAAKDFENGDAVLGAFHKLKKSDVEQFLAKYVKVYAQEPYRNYIRPLAETIPDDSFAPWAKNKRVKEGKTLSPTIFNGGEMEKAEANGIPLQIPFMPEFRKQLVGIAVDSEFERDYLELRVLTPKIHYIWGKAIPNTRTYGHEMLVFWDRYHREYLLEEKNEILLIEEGDGYFIFGNTATWPTQNGKQLQCDVELCLVYSYQTRE